MAAADTAVAGTLGRLDPSSPRSGLLDEPAFLPVFFDAFPDSLMLVEDGQIRLANSACTTLFGYADAREMVGRPLDDFLLLQQRFCSDMLKSSTPSACRHPSCERAVRRLNGEELRVQVRCSHFQHSEHALLLLVLRILSDVELARAVRDDRLRFRTIFEGAGIGIATSTLEGRIIESNPALTGMLGYTPEEFAGMHARELHPGDFEVDEQLLDELTRGERQSFQLEKSFRRKDGTYVFGHLTVSLVCGADGDPAFLIAMIEDTTARKRAEERLRDAEKMEVIGRFAGSIAHDFNNFLTGILLYSDLVLAGMPAENPLRSQVEEIRIAGDQGSALTQQLLAIARKQAPQLKPVHLNEVLASVEKMLRRLIGEHIDLRTVPGSDLGVVFADPAQLRQVILNLTLNARDAMPQGGTITISTNAKFMPASRDRAVSLIVEDTGLGMDAETRAHLFEPFFTTKEAGHGTGLGLATVDRIVKEAGGRIEVESESGRGTRIEIFLPVMRSG